MSNEFFKRLGAILQAFDVRDIAAAFYKKRKIFWASLIPARKDFFIRQPVKRNIQLHRDKPAGIVFKPFSGRQILGIKNFFPVVVSVAAGADL